MKKREISKLKLNKKQISTLNYHSLRGGVLGLDSDCEDTCSCECSVGCTEGTTCNCKTDKSECTPCHSIDNER
ncbi:MAG: hypothetical protein AAF611_18430 [Bacteroidota bacterium]